MSVERHDLLKEDVGAYLLDALDDAERGRFEAHLRECPVCADEVERLRPAVWALPRSVVPVTPPASLRAALMHEVEAEVREREGVGPRRPGRVPRMAEWIARAGARAGQLSPRGAVLAASIVLLAGVVAGAVGLLAVEGITEDDQSRTASARTIVAKFDKTRVPLGSGSLALPADRDNGAVLRVHGLRPLEEGSVYQVWVSRRGETIPQSLFSVGEDGDGAAAVTEDLDDADAVMVTREQAGGAKAPSEEPILTVAL